MSTTWNLQEYSENDPDTRKALSEAIKSLRNAIFINPNEIKYNYYLAYYLEKSNQPSEAIKFYNICIKLANDSTNKWAAKAQEAIANLENSINSQ